MFENATTLHASCIAVNGKAVLILGPSGSGKSALALQLISLGGMLVSDDRTKVIRQDHQLFATAPFAIRGLIEARGVGLLRLDHAGPTPVDLIVDLSVPETQRLPEVHQRDIAGVRLRCLHNPDTSHFAAAIYLYMRGTMEPLR